MRALATVGFQLVLLVALALIVRSERRWLRGELDRRHDDALDVW